MLLTLPQIGVMPSRKDKTRQGRVVRILRERAGLSQAALARRVNSTQQQIHKIENDERQLTLSWILRLAPALGCHPSEMLGETYILSPEMRRLLEIVGQLDEPDRKQLVRIGETFSSHKSETNDASNSA